MRAIASASSFRNARSSSLASFFCCSRSGRAGSVRRNAGRHDRPPSLWPASAHRPERGRDSSGNSVSGGRSPFRGPVASLHAHPKRMPCSRFSTPVAQDRCLTTQGAALLLMKSHSVDAGHPDAHPFGNILLARHSQSHGGSRCSSSPRTSGSTVHRTRRRSFASRSRSSRSCLTAHRAGPRTHGHGRHPAVPRRPRRARPRRRSRAHRRRRQGIRWLEAARLSR